jgi:UDP-N-acetylglucosamine acyltransferase
MASAHVGHNSILGDQIILANGALVGGHVTIDDRVFLSGNCVVHQFVRIGRLAMMQGGSAISQDLPPFCMARGANSLCGLNSIGLRRAGFSSEQRLELRRLYHYMFRLRRQLLREAVDEARRQFTSEPAGLILDFVAGTKRGIIAHRSKKDGDEE